MKLTAAQRRIFDVTPEQASLLASHGFEPRVVWVRPGEIDMSAKYTKGQALAACVVPSEAKACLSCDGAGKTSSGAFCSCLAGRVEARHADASVGGRGS